MTKVEETSLKELIDSFLVYFRYVDDTFVITKKRTSTRQLLGHLSSCHPALKFTIEEESNDCLPFLDVKVLRNIDGSISTRIYHKPTWTGQYTNFHSFVPISVKRNIVRNLFNRIARLSSP